MSVAFFIILCIIFPPLGALAIAAIALALIGFIWLAIPFALWADNYHTAMWIYLMVVYGVPIAIGILVNMKEAVDAFLKPRKRLKHIVDNIWEYTKFTLWSIAAVAWVYVVFVR